MEATLQHFIYEIKKKKQIRIVVIAFECLFSNCIKCLFSLLRKIIKSTEIMICIKSRGIKSESTAKKIYAFIIAINPKGNTHSDTSKR